MKGSEPELSSLAKRLSKNRGLVSLLTSDCKILVIDSNEAVGLWDTTAKTVRDYVLFEAKINRIVVRVDRLRFRVDELSHELNLIYDQVSSIAFSPKKISAETLKSQMVGAIFEGLDMAQNYITSLDSVEDQLGLSLAQAALEVT